MARKVDPNAKPQPKPDASAEDLNVLMPDVPIEISGRSLVVREYSFIAGLHARAKARPFIDDLESMVKDGAAADAGIEDYIDLMAKHDVLVRELMADSIDGADADFIDGLNAADGYALMATWWGVAGRFFVRVVAGRLRDRLFAELRRTAALAGPTSSTPSPLPDTVPPASSATATPSVN